MVARRAGRVVVIEEADRHGPPFSFRLPHVLGDTPAMGIQFRVGLLVIYACVASCGRQEPFNEPQRMAPIRPQVSAVNAQAAKAALLKEPQIKDLVYQPRQTVEWLIGVLDDGSPRYGYAQYVCEVLKSHQATDQDTIVRVVDVVKFTRGDIRGSRLGSLRCSDYRRDPLGA